jgi:WD40 repeat protein
MKFFCQHRTFFKIFTGTVVCACLAACSGAPSASTSTSTVVTAVPSAQPTQTRPAATLTATLPLLAQDGTALPPVAGVIQPQNAGQLKLIARRGYGFAQQAAWNADGSQLAVATTRGLYFFDTLSRRLGQSIEIGAAFRCLAFSPQGDLLAAGSEDGRLFIWNVGETQPRLILRVHNSPVLSLAFSPDGGQIATGSWERLLRVWSIPNLLRPLDEQQLKLNAAAQAQEIRNASLMVELDDHLSGPQALSYTADGSRLFSWSSRDAVKVFSVEEFRRLKDWYIGTAGGGITAYEGAFAEDGALFAAAQTGQVRIFNTGDGTTLALLRSFQNPLLAVAVSSAADLTATLEKDIIKIWQTSKGALLRTYALPEEMSSSPILTFSPDGKILALISDSLSWWDPTTDDGLLEALPPSFSGSYQFFTQFAGESNDLLASLIDGRILSMNSQDGYYHSLLYLKDAAINRLVTTADQTLAAGSTADGRVLFWQLPEGTLLPSLRGLRRNIHSLALSPDGALLAAGTTTDAVSIWGVADGKLVTKLSFADGADNLAFSPDGDWLAASNTQQTTLWRADDWQAELTMPGNLLVFAPSGNVFALLSVQNGKQHVEVRSLDDTQHVNSDFEVQGSALAFSPDGSLLAVSGAQLTLFDTARGEPAWFIDNPSPYGQPVISSDGRLLALSGWDGTLFLYGIP